jgi:hypothetical protein
MRKELLATLAVVALGTTGALAQAAGDTPAEPQIEQKAPSADAAQPAEPKARMPMRREQPLVPDTSGKSSSEGAGTGTSGADAPSTAAPPAPPPAGAAPPSATEPAPPAQPPAAKKY